MSDHGSERNRFHQGLDDLGASISREKCTVQCTNQSDKPSQIEHILINSSILLSQICHVLTVMDYSGRIDHILAQINSLYKASNFLVGVNVFLLTKNSLSWLLQPGQHHIQIPHQFVHDQRWCSLIPVGNPCRVSTTGLKWDMGEYDLVLAQYIRHFHLFFSSFQTTQFVNLA